MFSITRTASGVYLSVTVDNVLRGTASHDINPTTSFHEIVFRKTAPPTTLSITSSSLLSPNLRQRCSRCLELWEFGLHRGAATRPSLKK